MSRLLSTIMLAILMFPIAVLVYTVSLATAIRALSYRSEHVAFPVAGGITWAFLAFYWWVLWETRVSWTSERKITTVAATGASVAAAAIAGVLMGGMVRQPDFGWFIASVTGPLLWLFLTVFIWRETPAERADRTRHTGADALACPTCGYNLTGLKSTRCPECGTEFTLDQILSAQPARATRELEQA